MVRKDSLSDVNEIESESKFSSSDFSDRKERFAIKGSPWNAKPQHRTRTHHQGSLSHGNPGGLSLLVSQNSSPSTKKLPDNQEKSFAAESQITPKNYYEHKKFLLEMNQQISSEDEFVYFPKESNKSLADQNPYEVKIGMEQKYINATRFNSNSHKWRLDNHNPLTID